MVLTTIWRSNRLKENKERHEWKAALMTSCAETRDWGLGWWQRLSRHPAGGSSEVCVCLFVVWIWECVSVSVCVCYWETFICKWVDPWPPPNTAVHTSTPGPTPYFILSSLTHTQPWMCAFLLTVVTKIRAHQGRASWEAITGSNGPLFTC